MRSLSLPRRRATAAFAALCGLVVGGVSASPAHAATSLRHITISVAKVALPSAASLPQAGLTVQDTVVKKSKVQWVACYTHLVNATGAAEATRWFAGPGFQPVWAADVAVFATPSAASSALKRWKTVDAACPTKKTTPGAGVAVTHRRTSVGSHAVNGWTGYRVVQIATNADGPSFDQLDLWLIKGNAVAHVLYEGSHVSATQAKKHATEVDHVASVLTGKLAKS